MNPIRRKLLVSVGWSALAGVGAPAFAQKPSPREGTEYRLVSPPLSPDDATKVEVIEFFSYACPHCFDFEPSIEPWIKALPAYVTFERVPVVYHETWLGPARLYYTLDALGENKRLDPAVFDAIHKEHLNLSSQEAIAKFLETKGIPQKKFADAYNSFSVQSKMRRGDRLQAEYKIDQVPELAIDGRFVTSNSMVGGKHEDVLPVADYLIELARKERKLPKA